MKLACYLLISGMFSRLRFTSISNSPSLMIFTPLDSPCARHRSIASISKFWRLFTRWTFTSGKSQFIFLAKYSIRKITTNRLCGTVSTVSFSCFTFQQSWSEISNPFHMHLCREKPNGAQLRLVFEISRFDSQCRRPFPIWPSSSRIGLDIAEVHCVFANPTYCLNIPCVSLLQAWVECAVWAPWVLALVLKRT